MRKNRIRPIERDKETQWIKREVKGATPEDVTLAPVPTLNAQVQVLMDKLNEVVEFLNETHKLE